MSRVLCCCGVVSGMNIEGVAIVVHGARSGAPQAQGEPVVHALRRVLSSAHNTDEAQEILEAGLKAAASGAEVSLPLKGWQAGERSD